MNISYIYKVLRYRYHYIGLAQGAARNMVFPVAFCMSVTLAKIVIGSPWNEIWLLYGLMSIMIFATLFAFSFRNQLRIYNDLSDFARKDKQTKEALERTHYPIDRNDYYLWLTMECYLELTKKLDEKFIKEHPGIGWLDKIMYVYWSIFLVTVIIEVIIHMLGI